MKITKLRPTLDLDVPRYDCPKAILGVRKTRKQLEVSPVCMARKDYLLRNWRICKDCKIKPSIRKKREKKKERVRYKKLKPVVKNILTESIYI